ncbi:MAG: hypothetical protein AAGA29_07265 [Planctomycetota bacterium]
MPKPALIADPSKREIAIAVVMGLVLTVSILLVVALTDAPVFQATATPDNTAAQGPQ